MIARAPGKLVLSGAYSVLEGAPAIVAAVDRYVTADAARPADRITAEVDAAMALGRLAQAPSFDATPLRVALPDGTSRKIGLGSSAAILVASLAAAERPTASARRLRARIFRVALGAHRAAQPGGSGIDVAASTYGRVIRAVLRPGHGLDVARHCLPEGVVVEVFSCPDSASTADLLKRVRALEARDRTLYRRLIEAAGRGAEAAVRASSIPSLRRALDVQIDALAALGEAACAPIVTPEVAALRAAAAVSDAAFGPSGAGGGDIAIYLGGAPSSARFRALAEKLGLTRIDLAIGAAGVHQKLDR